MGAALIVWLCVYIIICENYLQLLSFIYKPVKITSVKHCFSVQRHWLSFHPYALLCRHYIRWIGEAVVSVLRLCMNMCDDQNWSYSKPGSIRSQMVPVKAPIERACPQALAQLLESRQWEQKVSFTCLKELHTGNICVRFTKLLKEWSNKQQPECFSFKIRL